MFSSKKKQPTEKKKRKAAVQPVVMPVWLAFIVPTLSFIVAGLIMRQGDPLTAILVVCLSLSALIGFQLGLFRQLIIPVGILVASLFAPYMGMNYEERFENWVGTTGLLNRGICVLGIGLIIALIVILSSDMLFNYWSRTRRKLQLTNKYAGMVVGCLFTLVAFGLCCGGSILVYPEARWSGDDGPAAEPKGLAQQVAAATYRSALSPLMTQQNPMRLLLDAVGTDESILEVHQYATAANVKRVLDDPSFQRSVNEQEINLALADLRDEPAWETIDASEGFQVGVWWQWMQSPAFLSLIEQPSFRQALVPALVKEAKQNEAKQNEMKQAIEAEESITEDESTAQDAQSPRR